MTMPDAGDVPNTYELTDRAMSLKASVTCGPSGQTCDGGKPARACPNHGGCIDDESGGGGIGCQFVYDGRAGGRKGQVCGRPESDHCKARGGAVAEHPAEHDDECRLSEVVGIKKRSMVHHPFHRGTR